MADDKNRSLSRSDRAFSLFQDRSARLGRKFDKKILALQCFADAEIFESVEADVASGKIHPGKRAEERAKASVLNDGYAPNLKPAHRINRLSRYMAVPGKSGKLVERADLVAAEKDAEEALAMTADDQRLNNIEFGKIAPA